MTYIKREKCIVSGDELEFLKAYDFPLFCGTTSENANKDIIAKTEFSISKSGVLQLSKLIPLEILYKNGHFAGNVGSIWKEHHEEFAKFIMNEKPKNALEIGGL